MRIEDRDEFVDRIAQAVIDKIEEHDRVEGIVNLVVRRVIAMQAEQAQAQAVLDSAAGNGTRKEETHAPE